MDTMITDPRTATNAENKKVAKVSEPKPKHAIPQKRAVSFIEAQGPSSLAAAERLAATQNFLFNWKQELNSTDTKQMPRANLSWESATTKRKITMRR